MNLILVLIYVAVMVAVAVVMEWVAWLLHKYVMHGPGWFLHEDHHKWHDGKFEKNDLYAVFFSVLSFVMIISGVLSPLKVLIFIGIGLAVYGVGYFGFHDVLFHHRIKHNYDPKKGYLRRILDAHTIHHQRTTVKDGVCFGFLYAGREYEREIAKSNDK